MSLVSHIEEEAIVADLSLSLLQFQSIFVLYSQYEATLYNLSFLRRKGHLKLVGKQRFVEFHLNTAI